MIYAVLRLTLAWDTGITLLMDRRSIYDKAQGNFGLDEHSSLQYRLCAIGWLQKAIGAYMHGKAANRSKISAIGGVDTRSGEKQFHT